MLQGRRCFELDLPPAGGFWTAPSLRDSGVLEGKTCQGGPEQAMDIPGLRHAYFGETVCDAVSNGTCEGLVLGIPSEEASDASKVWGEGVPNPTAFFAVLFAGFRPAMCQKLRYSDASQLNAVLRESSCLLLLCPLVFFRCVFC